MHIQKSVFKTIRHKIHKRKEGKTSNMHRTLNSIIGVFFTCTAHQSSFIFCFKERTCPAKEAGIFTSTSEGGGAVTNASPKRSRGEVQSELWQQINFTTEETVFTSLRGDVHAPGDAKHRLLLIPGLVQRHDRC